MKVQHGSGTSGKKSDTLRASDHMMDVCRWTDLLVLLSHAFCTSCLCLNPNHPSLSWCVSVVDRRSQPWTLWRTEE